MAFEDLREQLKEGFGQVSSRIQESDAFQQIKERYESLSPSMQKIVKGVSLFAVVIISISIPYSIYSGSTASEDTFVYYRDMTRDLLKTETEVAQLGRVSSGYDDSRLSSRARSAVMASRIQPSQIKSISPFVPQSAQKVKGIPATVKRAGVKVSLSNLNLKQMIKVSSSLERIDSSVKVWDMSVKATPQNSLYYDVDYNLVSFYMPKDKTPKAGKRSRGKRPKSRRAKRRGK